MCGQLYTRPLIACSHRRPGQDKTRQFCLVRVGGVNKLLEPITKQSYTRDVTAMTDRGENRR